jgi:hypothetical protein
MNCITPQSLAMQQLHAFDGLLRSCRFTFAVRYR